MTGEINECDYLEKENGLENKILLSRNFIEKKNGIEIGNCLCQIFCEYSLCWMCCMTRSRTKQQTLKQARCHELNQPCLSLCVCVCVRVVQTYRLQSSWAISSL